MRYWGWLGFVVVLLCGGCAADSESSRMGETALTSQEELGADAQKVQPLAEPSTNGQPVATAPVRSASQQGAAPAAPAVTPKGAPGTPEKAVVPRAVPSNAAPVAAKPTSTEQNAYKNALAAYQGHRAVEAEKLFDSFMATYPSSKLAPNALYWKGECLYLRGKYAEALFIFKDVTTRYPTHAKGADALLKAGMSFSRLGDVDSAKLHYRVLYEDYPNSHAARRGKEMGLHP